MRSPCNAMRIVYYTTLPVGKYSRSLREWDLDSECFSWRERARRNSKPKSKQRFESRSSAYPLCTWTLSGSIQMSQPLSPLSPLGFLWYPVSEGVHALLPIRVRRAIKSSSPEFSPSFSLMISPMILKLVLPSLYILRMRAIQFAGGNQRSVRPPLCTICVNEKASAPIART